MTGLKIQCTSCAGIYHETTEHFDPLQALNGTMFALLPEYGPNGHNWSSFPSDTSARDADLECPGCGNPYPGSIRLVLASGRTLSMSEARLARQQEEAKLMAKQDSPLDGVRWNDLRRMAVRRGVYKGGMNKQEVIAKLMELADSEEEAQAQRAESP